MITKAITLYHVEGILRGSVSVEVAGVCLEITLAQESLRVVEEAVQGGVKDALMKLLQHA